MNSRKAADAMRSEKKPEEKSYEKWMKFDNSQFIFSQFSVINAKNVL